MLPRKLKRILILTFIGLTAGLIALILNSARNVRTRRKHEPPNDPIVKCYPLALPNLPAVVDDILAGRNVSVSPINRHYDDMEFLPGSACPCSREGPVDILLLIKSAPNNHHNRLLLRSMWANSSYLAVVGAQVTYAFLIGTKQFSQFPQQLIDEAKTNNDLIFMDFIDSYRNNTYKTMGAMKWTLENCEQAKYIALVDDDIFLNVKNVVRFVQDPKLYPRSSWFGSAADFSAGSKDELFAGKVRPTKDFRPHRNPNITWYVSWEEYPCKENPVFFPGMTTIFSMYTLQQFFTAVRFIKHLSIDDVYLGVIASKLGVRRTNIANYIIDYPKANTNCKAKPRLKKNLISAHLKDELKRIEYWKNCKT